jgi:gluconate kinase
MRKPFQVNTIFSILQKHLGVQYIYAENLDTDANSLKTKLTSELLEVMPAEWLNKLWQVSIAGDDKQALIVISEISATHSYLAQVLNQLIHEYQFEPIINLIEPLIK